MVSIGKDGLLRDKDGKPVIKGCAYNQEITFTVDATNTHKGGPDFIEGNTIFINDNHTFIDIDPPKDTCSCGEGHR